MRNLIALPAFVALVCTSVLAADFWDEKPSKEWSSKQVDKMLTDSPWAKKVSVYLHDLRLAQRVGGLSGGLVGTGGGAGRPGGGGGPGGAGAGNLGGGGFMPPPRRTQLPLRWLSALPIKQALRRAADTDTEAPAKAEDSLYRLALVGLPRDVVEGLGDLSVIRDTTQLKRRRGAPIAASDVRLQFAGEVLDVEFRFPRADPIRLEDREVEFETVLGQAKVSKKFKLEDMVLHGELQL